MDVMEQPKSVLHPERHARLVADIKNICATANVPELFVYNSMKSYCGADEIDWVVNFSSYKKTFAGLVLKGLPNPDTRCMAIAGALLRNFKDARVMTVSQILEATKNGKTLDFTCLLIPNLYVVTTKGNALTSWQSSLLYDVLLSRFVANKPTVVAVENLSALEEEYGSVFAQHLKMHYRTAVD